MRPILRISSGRDVRAVHTIHDNCAFMRAAVSYRTARHTWYFRFDGKVAVILGEVAHDLAYALIRDAAGL